MKFAAFEHNGQEGLATLIGDRWTGLLRGQEGFPGTLDDLIASGEDLSDAAKQLASGTEFDIDSVQLLSPIRNPRKIICVGLNYRDHAAETDLELPDYPTLFTRFASTLTGHGAPVFRPAVSEQLDYEGEIVTIIGRGGKNIPIEHALDHVVGWSLFNDISVRDYQFRTPQWTVGKNFDSSGPMGPWLVTADEVPRGARDLVLETRLNGQVVQHASTNDMVFDVETLIVTLSQVMTLEAGDLIVTGTPSGVGMARKPPLWMKAGDRVEVEVQGIGLLSNPIVDG